MRRLGSLICEAGPYFDVLRVYPGKDDFQRQLLFMKERHPSKFQTSGYTFYETWEYDEEED